MSNPSKAKGTSAESAVVRVMKDAGLRAKRLTLHGSKDVGDVDCGIDAIVVEVKGGKTAESASDGQITAWLVETDNEVRNANAKIGVLVVKRKGIGPANAERWWAITSIRELDILMGTENPFPSPWYHQPIRMHLSTFISVILTFAQREGNNNNG